MSHLEQFAASARLMLQLVKKRHRKMCNSRQKYEIQISLRTSNNNLPECSVSYYEFKISSRVQVVSGLI